MFIPGWFAQLTKGAMIPMNMRHISLLLALCLLICCVACSAEETPPASDNVTTVVTAATTVTTAEATTEATTAEATTTTETTAIIPTTQNSTSKKTTTTRPPTSAKDGRQAWGTTKDGFEWVQYPVYINLGASSRGGRYEKLNEYVVTEFGVSTGITLFAHTNSKAKRVVLPETIAGYPVIAVNAYRNKAIKEVVLHKYITIYNQGAYPNATDFYMPEEFASGQLPYVMDEWPAEGITYHIPAASPLAAQLREKLTAAGVTHDLLTEDAVGVLDLSEADPIEADGKISFE